MARGRRGHQQVEEDMEGDMRANTENGEPNMLEVIRVLMAEQRRSELDREERKEEARRNEEQAMREAKRVEDNRLEELRMEREAEARKQVAELQAAADARQFEQQVQLLKIQAEMGDKASKAHREAAATDRRRDRALFNIASCKEEDDLEEFMMVMERRLEVAGIAREEWVTIVESKLSGKVAIAWQDVVATTENYQEARDKLLKSCGYTPRVAADKFFGFKVDQSKGLTADQLYHTGQQLSRRMLAPGRLNEEMEFALVKGWIGMVIPRKARAAMDARVTENAAELVSVLQDFLALEGEGRTATFKKSGGAYVREFARDKPFQVTCFKCGKVGHKAADCWKGSSSVPKSGTVPSTGVAPKIVCHTCGVEGHKSPQCPRRGKGSAEVKPKPVKRIWKKQPKSLLLDGIVNGHEAQVLLDSGADISVVPADMVADSQLCQEQVAVKPFGASTAMLLPMADIEFTLGEICWEERVAVAPTVEGVNREVLCSLDLKSERGLQLVLMANGVEQKEVARMTTRAQAKVNSQEAKEDEVSAAVSKPIVKPLVPDGQEVSNEPGKGEGLEVIEQECLGIDAEEEMKFLDVEMCSSDDEEEEVYQLTEYAEDEESIEIPPVKAGGKDRAALVAETLSDPTLEGWRKGAEKGGDGLEWKDGLLYRTVANHDLESVCLLVLPESKRKRVLELAHEKLGHMGARRVKSLIRQKFAWPGMGQEVIRHCRSCVPCQKGAKNPARKVPLVERAVLTEPFEVMAVDLVGPLPVGKGGYRYLLTAICMASRWPEAIPLRKMTARAVAAGLVEIFSRTGIPLQLVSDQGTQFVGKVVKQLCESLHIDRIRTTPYHPEGNGVVERMHGTLGPMLTKASAEGLDWVGQVPFAMFALRSAPNRDSLYSPFELVYGRQVRTPLDILHQGWVELEFEELNTSEWAEWLVDRLQCWHEVMRQRSEVASKKRKKAFDRKSVLRLFEVGDRVLCRIPGMTHKLQESWHGPYPVVEVLNRVDYKIEFRKGCRKVLHVNNLKKFHGREEDVMRLAVIAENMSEDEDVGITMRGELAVPELRATAMEEFKLPVTKKQLRSFLGSMSYYRRFIKDFASYSCIPSPETFKKAPSVVVWNGDRLEAFNTLKGILCTVCALTIPSSEDCFSLNTDASGLGIGATLNVNRDGVEKPVAFFSRQLQGAQKLYSATELEGLAVFKSIFFFDHFLYGRKFLVYTDHQALVSLLRSKRLNKRLQGWILRLMEFEFEIIYRPGTANGDADGLSRQAWSIAEGGTEAVPDDVEQLRAAEVFELGEMWGQDPTEELQCKTR